MSTAGKAFDSAKMAMNLYRHSFADGERAQMLDAQGIRSVKTLRSHPAPPLFPL